MIVRHDVKYYERGPIPILPLLAGCTSDLKAGGNRGILIVRGLRVSNQIIPAGEHFPAEGKFSFLSSITSFICITSHPEKKPKTKVMKDGSEKQH